MACLDRNTDVTAVSTQVPVIRLTHGVESCFFHDSITVLVTIVCFQPNHYLRKLISKVNPSFKFKIASKVLNCNRILHINLKIQSKITQITIYFPKNSDAVRYVTFQATVCIRNRNCQRKFFFFDFHT